MAKDCNMPTRCGNCKKNGHTWKECPSIKYAKCGEKGHVAGNCYSEKINWLEDIVEPLQILKRPTKQLETVESIAPLKRATFRHPVEQQDPFDVVETLWRTPTNMTFGQLLQDDTYRAEMMKALEAEKVQALTPRETRTTQALKAYIKLKGTPLLVLLDIGASVSAISKDLA